MPYCRLFARLIGVAIAAGTIPSIAGAQNPRAISAESGETHNTETSVGDAQIDPATTLRVLVPCPVGSPADIVARRLAQMLSVSADGQFHVENVPGTVNPTMAERALADGRTLLFLPADPTMPSACGD